MAPPRRRCYPGGVLKLSVLLIVTAAPVLAEPPPDLADEPVAAAVREHLPFGFPGTAELRFRKGYVVSHNNWLKIPNWVAYRLTSEYLAGKTPRGSDFRTDDSFKPHQRAELEDYKASGYDRGHLAPAGDMKRTRQAMSESFYLSNMAPQVGAGFNRGIWEELEKKVRHWALRRREVWVFTGPAFRETQGEMRFLLIGPHRVAVPTHFFKILASRDDDASIDAIAFLIPNEPTPREKLREHLTTIDEIEEHTGLDFLDALPDDVENDLERKKAAALW